MANHAHARMRHAAASSHVMFQSQYIWMLAARRDHVSRFEKRRTCDDVSASTLFAVRGSVIIISAIFACVDEDEVLEMC